VYHVVFYPQALATVRERDRELKQQETLVHTLHKDRNQALATLRKHDIPVDKNINVRPWNAAKI
jgi:hypothetical protein